MAGRLFKNADNHEVLMQHRFEVNTWLKVKTCVPILQSQFEQMVMTQFPNANDLYRISALDNKGPCPGGSPAGPSG